MTSNSTLSYIGTWIFNSHPHKEDDDGQHVTSNLDQIFSTHILTRRMTMPLREAMARSVFQLTSSQGGWRSSLCDLHGWICHFQLTSSQGGWLFSFLHTLNGKTFSTHILTRRMTVDLDNRVIHVNFSTHILTRRMTAAVAYSYNRKIFQLTSSQGGWRRVSAFRLFHKIFNSHPHKEDDGDGTVTNALSVFFQLTSSQGGWPRSQ